MFLCTFRRLVKKPDFISHRNLNGGSGAKAPRGYGLFLPESVSLFSLLENTIEKKNITYKKLFLIYTYFAVYKSLKSPWEGLWFDRLTSSLNKIVESG